MAINTDFCANIAKDFEKEVESIYSKISKDLINSRDSYLNKSKNLYDYIHTTYPGVNDADVGIHEDLPNILDKLINSNLTFDYGMKNLNPEENNERGTKGNTQ